MPKPTKAEVKKYRNLLVKHLSVLKGDVGSMRDEALRASDFEPFRVLRDTPAGLTAHVCYEALDPERPGTLSRTVIEGAVRGAIGFDGLLVSDDLSMGALTGPIGERARAALAAGCELALHCNGNRDEMEDVAVAVPRLKGRARERFDLMLAWRLEPDSFDFAFTHTLSWEEVNFPSVVIADD